MSYRAVVRHVRYWRGTIHRWSTVYQFVGVPTDAIATSDCQTVLESDSAMCFALTAIDGGPYACEIYNVATGGVPIATYTLFDWTTPGSWVAASHTAWTGSHSTTEPAAEVALLVEWRAGFSKSGKPVNLRKWYHSVPVSLNNANVPQVSSTDLTSLQAHAAGMVGMLGAKGLTLGSGTGRFAGLASVDGYYGNHQMARGRRTTKKAAVQSGIGRAIQGIPKTLDVLIP